MTRTSQTRAKILEGAAVAVLKHGAKTCTVQDILKAAGVSRRTFYQYFDNREDAYLAMYTDATVKLMSEVAAATFACEVQGEKIVTGIRAYLRHQRESGPLLWSLQRLSLSADSPLHPMRIRVIDVMVNFIDEQFEELGGLKIDPLLFRGLVYSLDGLIRHLQDTDSFGDDEMARIDGMLEPVIEAVFGTVPHLPAFQRE